MCCWLKSIWLLPNCRCKFGISLETKKFLLWIIQLILPFCCWCRCCCCRRRRRHCCCLFEKGENVTRRGGGRRAAAEEQLLNLEHGRLFIMSAALTYRGRRARRCIDGRCIPFRGKAAAVFTGSTLLEHLIELSPRPLFCCSVLFPAVTSPNAPCSWTR